MYPKNRAVELAQPSKQNVPAMPTPLASNITTASQDQNSRKVNDMKQANVMAEKPTGEEVNVAEVFLLAKPVEQQRTLIALLWKRSAWMR